MIGTEVENEKKKKLKLYDFKLYLRNLLKIKMEDFQDQIPLKKQLDRFFPLHLSLNSVMLRSKLKIKEKVFKKLPTMFSHVSRHIQRLLGGIFLILYIIIK